MEWNLKRPKGQGIDYRDIRYTIESMISIVINACASTALGLLLAGINNYYPK